MNQLASPLARKYAEKEKIDWNLCFSLVVELTPNHSKFVMRLLEVRPYV